MIKKSLCLALFLIASIFAHNTHVYSDDALDTERVYEIVHDIGWAVGIDINRHNVPALLDKLNISSDEQFNAIVASAVNQYDLHDRRAFYCWTNDLDQYPDPIFFDEIIETDSHYILYDVKKTVILKMAKAECQAVKFVYYYRDITCLESDKLHRGNVKTISTQDQKRFLKMILG